LFGTAASCFLDLADGSRTVVALVRLAAGRVVQAAMATLSIVRPALGDVSGAQQKQAPSCSIIGYNSPAHYFVRGLFV
jgi:hypothetical protein